MVMRAYRHSSVPPQHAESPAPQQPQVSFLLPVIAALIIASAHPTPLCTLIAPDGQFFMQAPHSMQDAGLARVTTFSPGTKTPWGHTELHMPQLKQSFGLYTSVFSVYELNMVRSP
jgi:hypothetical protein